MELSQVPLLRDLHLEDLKALEEEAGSRRLKRGEVLFLEGEPVRSLFVVEEGLIKVYKLDPEGRKQLVLHLEGPGRVLAEVALFLDRPTYPASAEALEESQVLVIPKEGFFQLVEARPPGPGLDPLPSPPPGPAPPPVWFSMGCGKGLASTF